jgi:glycosyltransferase involved in cell wall biosynthesis
MKQPVLTIFYQFDPWHTSIGGIQTVVRNFIKFAPPKFRVRLVGLESTLDGPVGVWQKRTLAGRPVDFFPLFRLLDDDRRRLVPTSLRYALGLLGKNFSSDFMHFHRLETAFFTRSWTGHKTLFVHNDIHQQIRSSDAKSILWQKFPWLYFAFESRLIRQFDRVLSCNSESTELYQKQYPQLADRISFIRNTFDGDIFYSDSPEESDEKRRLKAMSMGLPEHTRFLLFAGRLHPQKDPLLLLESLSKVSDPRVHLLVAGEGEMALPMRERASQLGITQKITFLGALNYQELAELHRLSSIFVLTSAYEGLPLVVLEALACGTPIVTTRAGETPRLLNPGCGVVCSERSPEKIAKALDTVLNFPERFPSQACIENASPYSAKSVIEEVYTSMFDNWQSGRAKTLITI